MAYGQFEQFIRNLRRVMGSVNTKLQRDLTLRTRVARRFSMTEVADLLNIDITYLARIANDDEAFPNGERTGRERTFSPSEILLIRALIASNPGAKRQHIFWRKSGEPVRVVTFGAQKGGTGKSLSAAHFAQYVNLYYGLRVGIIDSDPQATISLYFADDSLPLFDEATPTLADFMGVDDPGVERLIHRSPRDLQKIWQPTPWPGTKLIPGGPNIQNGDISLFFMSQTSKIPVYRILKQAIATWDSGNGPKTHVEDLRSSSGVFDVDAYVKALNETVDVIVIDQQPSLTLMQLNGLIAADNVVVPQTMKGFDLATLTTYVSSIGDYLNFIMSYEPEIEIGKGQHVVLPTIIQEQNNQDTNQILDLFRQAPNDILKVWYSRSDAIANAAEQYKSIYEYRPPPARRASAKAFLNNANAVNDALVQRIWPELPPKGFADAFINQHWA